MKKNNNNDDHPEFDFNKKKPSGEELRDQGIERVVSNTPDEYKEAFWHAANTITIECFTSEDLTALCGMPPNHPHAVGGLMSGLIKGKVIEPVYDDAKSKVPSSHAARLRLYRRTRR